MTLNKLSTNTTKLDLDNEFYAELDGKHIRLKLNFFAPKDGVVERLAYRYGYEKYIARFMKGFYSIDKKS